MYALVSKTVKNAAGVFFTVWTEKKPYVRAHLIKQRMRWPGFCQTLIFASFTSPPWTSTYLLKSSLPHNNVPSVLQVSCTIRGKLPLLKGPLLHVLVE